MPLINPTLAAGAHLLARQALSSTIDTLVSSATAAATSAGSLSSSAVPSTTTSSPASTGTVANGQPGSAEGNGGKSGSPNSSPLLFFVALGFGVVFTNLWIIVGVKYCFRYNARNRQMRMNEDGEPITLENMPRPHRRRREKKLMSMDEVNEKFPMQKYKSWVAGRAHEGLPTRGGVSSPQGLADSVRDADGVIPDLPSKERESTEDRPVTGTTPNADPETQEPGHQAKESTSSTVAGVAPASTEPPQVPPTVTENPTLAKVSSSPHDDEDEDDEHINAALPPECMGTSGDTCAICIDSLEDDDDVRGLSCGHAFHAVCLDPWLTSRRACCPLCKADYYTPKPRPAAAEPGDGTAIGSASALRDSRRANMPSRPQATWMGIRGHSRMMLPSRFLSTSHGDHVHVHRTRSTQSGTQSGIQSGNAGGRFRFFNRSRQPESGQETVSPAASPTATTTSPTSSDQPQPQPQSRFAAFRSAFPAFRAVGRGNSQASTGPVASGAINDVTPSNLEAGVRPAESR
ncbi:hypothetical protein QBC33DRAFT_559129 [Phialemonium atrogriseum]|uniref:RING-type domain-containing protein n=1 Tax=Phialemonium atrogriseum TaxID=1093897 RepID=A0AAJ0FNC0_9PEZI|nr:uncharacterized protein QBC33DRAFT_559129 [Phialemonium atrogriseum]KAK1766995.1 hypothetical protein QBC33DRAFT_559129 [Phialemonium atrogriseum]